MQLYTPTQGEPEPFYAFYMKKGMSHTPILDSTTKCNNGRMIKEYLIW